MVQKLAGPTFGETKPDVLLQARLDASDAVQRTCLSVHKAIREFRGETPAEFLVWLRQIHEGNLYNLLREHLAQKRGIDREDPAAAEAMSSLIADSLQSTPSQRGFVYVDFNNDGEINFGEAGIGGVTITLTGTDDLGGSVLLTDHTDTEGFYRFENLRPGEYSITQTQPEGYLQGTNSIGTLDTVSGEIEVVDQFFIELPYADALDAEANTNGINYNFGERPMADGEISTGQTASIGFWNNKHGQALIRSLNEGTEQANQLGNWLAATFVNMFGVNAVENDLTGMTNGEVASFFQTLFAVRGQKLEAQVLATALAVYVTNSMLAGDAAESYGFVVTTHGVGNTTFNVGDSGAAFGVEDHL